MAAAAASLDDRIGDYASLVGLVLTLITLFTSQRADAVRRLPQTASLKRADFTTEVLLDSLLAVATLLLFLTGLPLFLDSLRDLHPLRDQGALRDAFVIVWALIPFLVLWQGTLVLRARAARKKWEHDHNWRATKRWW